MGGATPAAANVIAGNDVGVAMDGDGGLLTGNWIGTNAAGATGIGNGTGVTAGGSNNLIGGTDAGGGNVIAFNAGPGVLVGRWPDFDGTGNRVLGNSIHSNGGLGIDLTASLSPDGITLNDPATVDGDTDAGANGRQNFPVLTSVSAEGGATRVAGRLNSGIGAAYRIELFASDAADPSGHGEGGTLLGAIEVETNLSGLVEFETTLPVAAGAGRFVSATATNVETGHLDFNSTSEFSAAVQMPGGPPQGGTAPTAAVDAQQTAKAAGATSYDFTVTYADDAAVDFSTVDNTDVVVTGPNGFSAAATRVGPAPANAPGGTVTYRVPAPGGTLDPADNGTYTVTMQADQVRDTSGNAVAAGQIGTFTLNVPGGPVPPGDGPDLVVTAVMPGPVKGGTILGGSSKGRANVVVENRGNRDLSCAVGVSLFLSSDSTLDGNDSPVVTLPARPMRLRQGASKNLKAAFVYPAAIDGNYILLARAEPGSGVPAETNPNNNVGASASALAVREASVDLSGSFASPPSRTPLRAGRPGSLSLLLQNDGAVHATEAVTISLFASSDATPGGADDVAVGQAVVRLNLKPGRPKVTRLRVAVPQGLAAGSYHVVAVIDSGGQLAERDEANNTVLGTVQVA